MRLVRWFVWGFFVATTAFPAIGQAQQSDQLFSRGSQEAYRPQRSTTPPSFGRSAASPRRDPYGLQNAHQVVDKSDIELFVKQIAGAGDGTIIESEREQILSEFERRYNVFLPDREVLIVSDLDAKGLVAALENSVNQSNTSQADNQLQFTVRRGLPSRTVRGQSFEDLEPYNKQAYLNSIRFGNIPKGVRLPGLKPTAEGYGSGAYGDTYFSPSGSQKNIGLTGDYQSRVTRSPYTTGYPSQPQASYATSYEEARSQVANRGLINRSGMPTEVFRKLRSDPQLPGGEAYLIREIDNRAKEFYSNGRPRFDDNGNELHANGRRMFNDQGVPLYSNGQPKTDASGNPLHSNGRRMTTDDGRELFADGRPRTTRSGVELFRDGSRRWAGDGRNPRQAAKDYRPTVPGDKTDLGADPTAKASGPVSPTRALAGDTVPSDGAERRRQAEIQNRPLYADGTPAATQTGVKLYPDGSRRFSGDGIGSIIEPALPGASGVPPKGADADFVSPLYPDGAPAITRDGVRMYSSGTRRATDDGRPLYPTGLPLAAGDRALTPTGDRIVGSRGFQGRPQGTFDIYRIVDGQIREIDGETLTIRLDGRRSETKTFSLEEALIARDDQDLLLPATVDQLIPQLKVKVIARFRENFVDGRMVSSDEIGQAIAVLATNPRVGRDMPDGTYPVAYVAGGRARRLTTDSLTLTGPGLEPFDVAVDEQTAFQRQIRGETQPADLRAVGIGRELDLVVAQEVGVENGQVVAAGPQRAIAVLQR